MRVNKIRGLKYRQNGYGEKNWGNNIYGWKILWKKQNLGKTYID